MERRQSGISARKALKAALLRLANILPETRRQTIAVGLIDHLEPGQRARVVRSLVDRLDGLQREALTERASASAAGDERLARTLLTALDVDALDFPAWERAGLHVTKNHFLSPIPEVASLSEGVFARRSELAGIDMRDMAQLALLRRLGREFGAEFNALPRKAPPEGGFFLDNGAFSGPDAQLYYALLRDIKPKRVIEIGGGWSTMCAALALAVNAEEGAPGEIRSFEPYPYPFLRDLATRDSRVTLEETKVQAVPLSVFTTELDAGDVLFIDSSHVLKIDSDVQYEFLEILPRLSEGVHVHVHDIFLPYEYPRAWVVGEHRFWNEQYLLQAFMIFNRAFEVTLAGSYLHATYPDELAAVLEGYDAAISLPGSFWLKRV